MELFRQHRWKEAAAAFAASERMEPGTTDALLYQGKALVNLGDFPAAADALRGFLALHPKSDDALYLLAYVRFRENQPEESLQRFTEAALIKPPTADDLKVIALDYVLLNDYESAGRRLEEALQLDPGNMEALYHLGRVRYQQNRFDQAIDAFRKVLKRDPHNVKAEDNLGLSLEGKNYVDDAALAYRRAIRLDRASLIRTEQPYLDLGILLGKRNQSVESVALLEDAAQIAPQSATAHRELAKAYFALQRLEDARGEGQKAVQLDPADSSSHYLLGRIYHRLGKDDLATEQFTKTEELVRSERAKNPGMAIPTKRR
jgi:tetratricopeptide (TPR) repeat protein